MRIVTRWPFQQPYQVVPLMGTVCSASDKHPHVPPLLTALGDPWTQVRPRPWELSSSASKASAIMQQCPTLTVLCVNSSRSLLPAWYWTSGKVAIGTYESGGKHSAVHEPTSLRERLWGRGTSPSLGTTPC